MTYTLAVIYVQELQEKWGEALEGLRNIQPPEEEVYQKEWVWPMLDRAKIELALGQYTKAWEDAKKVYLAASKKKSETLLRAHIDTKAVEISEVYRVFAESAYVLALSGGLRNLQGGKTDWQGIWYYLKQYLQSRFFLQILGKQRKFRETPDQVFLRRKLNKMLYQRILSINLRKFHPFYYAALLLTHILSQPLQNRRVVVYLSPQQKIWWKNLPEEIREKFPLSPSLSEVIIQKAREEAKQYGYRYEHYIRIPWRNQGRPLTEAVVPKKWARFMRNCWKCNIYVFNVLWLSGVDVARPEEKRYMSVREFVKEGRKQKNRFQLITTYKHDDWYDKICPGDVITWPHPERGRQGRGHIAIILGKEGKGKIRIIHALKDGCREDVVDPFTRGKGIFQIWRGRIRPSNRSTN